MRAIVGFVGLLVVLAIVGLLAKTQLGSQARPPAASASDVSVPAVTPGSKPQQQSQQVQDQFKQSLEGALQQTRPMPDANK
jgi:multidrug efflux pump subunit AcrB